MIRRLLLLSLPLLLCYPVNSYSYFDHTQHKPLFHNISIAANTSPSPRDTIDFAQAINKLDSIPSKKRQVGTSSPKEVATTVEKTSLPKLSTETTVKWINETRTKYNNNENALTNAFKTALNQYPNNRLIRENYLIQLSWSNQFKQALEQLKHLLLNELTEQGLEASCFSARHGGKLNQALSLYNYSIHKHPQNLSFKLGKAMALFDLGQPKAAATTLNQIHLSYLSEEHSFQLASTYEYIQDFIKSREIYSITENKYSSTAATQKKILNTSRLGSADIAYQESLKTPELFSLNNRRELLANRAAKAVRLSTNYETDKQIRERRLEDALKKLNEYTDFLNENFPNHTEYFYHARVDRIIALYFNDKFKTVLEEYKVLDIPKSNKRAVEVFTIIANALLATKNPQSAQEHAQLALSQNATNFDALKALYYSQLELGQHSDAYQTIERLVASQPVWRYGKYSTIKKPNPHRLEAELIKQTHYIYTNNLNAAEKGLTSLLEQAPANTDIQTKLAVIKSIHGRHNAANDDFVKILKSEPELNHTKIEHAYNLIKMNEPDEATILVNDLNSISPNNTAVKRVSSELQHKYKQNLYISAKKNNSNGSSFSNDENIWEVIYHTTPINHHTRLFIRNTAYLVVLAANHQPAQE